ncbi:putative ribonuclease 3 [Tupanvirus deep ocean]|uniref:Ribonuclease 3 n=2 Tax=Tupanvirus TaxID=2094720 RepID=A0AC62A7W5_9VIRU|nr:putative ribonuclease 3 [Tupanvirus deep ocean]QKU33871.1 putative ribonuclease 3 [Tupanvirus deep ocean]
MSLYSYNNVINYPFIDYIIKCYVPELQLDEEKSKRVNMNIFKEAMLHVSTKTKEYQKTYERLEYLGDAIFHMIITEYFYKRYDEENEGFLTRLRIRIERGDSMAELTKILELDNYIQTYGINMNDHIMEDVFEAFLGAFYLNFGIKHTKTFVVKLIEKHKNLSELIYHDDNYKDLLLRYFHQMKWGHPIYEEEHNNSEKTFSGSKTAKTKRFVSIVKNPFGKNIGKGISTSKKKAEQLASKNALKNLGVIVNDEVDPDWINKIEKEEKEEKDKGKSDKKPMSVYNPNNKLLKRSDIKDILGIYNVVVPKDADINIRIFYEAMTHRSYLIRKKLTPEDKIGAKTAVKLQKKSNERLQFLGDSVIHFVIGEFLYHKYPKADEGFLTRLRCKLENRESLFYLAKQTDISSYLLVSQNIEVLHGRNNINIIGGGFEAFIGAIYLEIGLSTARQFILEVLRIELDISRIAENETNYKDLILQLYNKNHWGQPQYKIIKEEGPDHCKIFTMGIYLKGKLMGQGKASSKKKAEQIASKQMYVRFATKNN